MPVPPAVAPPKRQSHRLVSLMVAIALVLVVWAQRQALYDWWQLRNYQAPANIVALADATTMTPASRHTFYVNHPQVEDKAAFNQSCPANGGEQTIVLGCYISPQRGIHVYAVTDPQLTGVQEVTAAHEMLHSAYDRLSTKERARVDGLLQAYYDNDLHDKRLLNTIESYKKTEPDDLLNEMHSIFATEIASLPPALEDYYKQYFTNRQAVTSLAAQYQQAFTSRQDQISDYDAQLKALKAQIDSNQATLDTQLAALSSQRSQINRSLNSVSAAEYNAQVASFNAQVSAYNQLLSQTKALIARYNDITAKRNAVAVEAQNLSQQLNSHLETQSAQ